ncbi:MAG: hypothetical protein WD403_06630 [Pirellulales bacterium]
MHLRPLALLACCLAAIGSMAVGAPARGEVFVLANGGRVEGEIVNPDELPREKYVIQTATGGRLTLDKSQVKQVIRRRPEEVEYEKIRPQYPDTIEGQLQLAEWCREHQLLQFRERHLRRVIELEPDHLPARRALGYTRLEGGDWKTRHEIMTERGYVQYKGQWITPEELELRERNRKNELAEKEWHGKVKRWRGWLDTDKAEEALRQFDQIADPYAVKALAAALNEEVNDQLRRVYIRSLARVGTPQAYQVLIVQSLGDADEEVRLTCLDYIDDEPRPAAVKHYISKLRSKDNVEVNRAAVGLARLNDPQAISALIDALVTTHKFKIQTGQPGGYNATFSPDGGVNSFGSSGGPKIISRKIQNSQVLDALVLLTQGVNFNYDVKTWKSWFAAQKRPHGLNARRD